MKHSLHNILVLVCTLVLQVHWNTHCSGVQTMQSINMSLCTFGIYIHWVYSTVAHYTKDSSSVSDRARGGGQQVQFAPGTQTVLNSFKYTSQSSFYKDFLFTVFC